MKTLFVLAILVLFSGCAPDSSPPPSDPLRPLGFAFEEATASPASYSYLSVNLFQATCTTCHSGAKPPKGIDLTTYANLISSGAIVPGNPAASLAYTEVTAGKMPPKNGPVPAALQQDLLAWIQAGAPND